MAVVGVAMRSRVREGQRDGLLRARQKTQLLAASLSLSLSLALFSYSKASAPRTSTCRALRMRESRACNPQPLSFSSTTSSSAIFIISPIVKLSNKVSGPPPALPLRIGCKTSRSRSGRPRRKKAPREPLPEASACVVPGKPYRDRSDEVGTRSYPQDTVLAASRTLQATQSTSDYRT